MQYQSAAESAVGETMLEDVIYATTTWTTAENNWADG
jgi:hypothetical protein